MQQSRDERSLDEVVAYSGKTGADFLFGDREQSSPEEMDQFIKQYEEGKGMQKELEAGEWYWVRCKDEWVPQLFYKYAYNGTLTERRWHDIGNLSVKEPDEWAIGPRIPRPTMPTAQQGILAPSPPKRPFVGANVFIHQSERRWPAVITEVLPGGVVRVLQFTSYGVQPLTTVRLGTNASYANEGWDWE